MPRTPKSATQPSPSPILFDDQTHELLRAKARQIRHRIRLPRTDLADLEQDLALHVWPRLGRYDPACNPDPAAFVRMLVGHAAATVLRSHARRRRRSPASLDALLHAGMPEPPDPRAWPGPAEQRGVALDVDALLATLPRQLRRVAEALKHDSVVAAARRLKMPRTTLYRRLAELRAACASAGLGNYFPNARTPRARPG